MAEAATGEGPYLGSKKSPEQGILFRAAGQPDSKGVCYSIP